MDVVAALEAAHAALDAVSLLDEHGALSGWAPLEADPVVLAEVVRLAARLEGRTSGLKLHVVAAAEQANAAEVVASGRHRGMGGEVGRRVPDPGVGRA